jgi:hypothetical protein
MTSNLEDREAKRVRELARIQRRIVHAEIHREKIVGELTRVNRQLERDRQHLSRLEQRLACTQEIQRMVA